MNPRQRRGVLLIVVAALGMIGVFIAISSYVSDVRSETDPKVSVLRLTQDVKANEAIDESMFESVEVPERYVADSALTDPISVTGVATSDYESGTYLQRGMIVPPPAAKGDEREISILVDAETGVGGRVNPDDVVDIVATFAETEQAAQQSRFQIEQARVVAVGLPEQVQQESLGGNLETQSVVPITFAVNSDEALELAYAESFAEDVRLLKLPALKPKAVPDDRETFEIGPEGGTFSPNGG